MPFSTGQAVPVSYPVLMGGFGPVLKVVFLAVYMLLIRRKNKNKWEVPLFVVTGTSGDARTCGTCLKNNYI